MIVICNYCGKAARLVLGPELYPHRRDLAHVKAWACDPCGAKVGCHDGTDKPKGTLAKPQLGVLRMAVHRLFDPLWENWASAYESDRGAPDKVLRRIARERAYNWLTAAMGESGQVHIGEMNEARCELALGILREQRPTPTSIRAWAKARKAAA